MKQRDLELLSSYLDGQLSPADVTRLEARLLVEPDLRSVLRDLRSARTMLRQLPMRKAPRNFRLTPKMVGKNPPLPRAYPAFRFTSALATILLFLSFGLNLLRPQLLAAQPTGFGMGGGGAPDLYANSAPAAEMPAMAATEMPATEAPAEESAIESAPMATATIAAQADTTRAMETDAAKAAATEMAAAQGVPAQPIEPQAAPPVISSALQWLLAGIALASVFIMALMRQLAVNRWRAK